MPRVTFTIGDQSVHAELNPSATAEALMAALPLAGNGSYWGAEFYFPAPIRVQADATATEVVEPGTVAFWVEGSCVCLFWGATPASRQGECRAASAVNVLGRVTNPEVLPRLKGRTVRVEAVADAAA